MNGSIINGQPTDETLEGTDGSDIILGDYGNDQISGGDGNDTLDGGRGSDLLDGGDGNDTIVLGSDAGEPVIAQDYDPDEGRNDEIDPATDRLYPNQPFVADDVAIGGEGADTFLIKPQLNAKADIIAKHTDDDGRIDWANVAGENNNAHDHWIDSIGTDVIADFDKEEGDRILVYGHTVDPEISYEDVDGDGDEESIIKIYSNQGGNGGAHDGDFLGQVIVHGDRVEENDIDVSSGETYGIVETIDEILEAVAPTGVSDQDIESTASENPFLASVDTRDPDEAVGPAFVEETVERSIVDAADDTLTGTDGDDVLEGDPAPETPASLDQPISFWSFESNDNGSFADARGVSDANYYLYDNNNNNQAVLQDSTPILPGPDGGTAAFFGSNGKTFAYAANDDSYQVLNATVTAWFNPVDLGGNQTIISKDERNADGGGHFHVRVEGDGKLFIRVAEGEGRNDGGYNNEWRSKEPVINEGNWQHIALTIGANGIAVYLDGQQLDDDQFNKVGGAGEDALSDFAEGYLIGNDKPFVIGANTRVSAETDTAEALGVDARLSEFFEGGIAQVGFWGGDNPDDALSADQVAELYANGPGEIAEGTTSPDPVPVGDDTISGGAGNDDIDGGAGNDTLDGGAGDDDIQGGYGNDLITGGDDDDSLDGGHGEDNLDGGDGDDVLLSRADDREPEIAQDFDRSDDPDYEVDFDARMVYPSQADMASDDILTGGAGADEFKFETLLNAKLDIINRHVEEDRTIDWRGVAGENRDVHDHWVDGIGDDTVTDFNQEEGDTISIEGHTTEVFQIDHEDVDGDGDTDTVLHLRSNQGNGGGAHNLDLLGTITVLDNVLDEDDFTVDAGVFYGIVDTIDEYREAVTPLSLASLTDDMPGDPVVDDDPVADDDPVVDDDPVAEDDSEEEVEEEDPVAEDDSNDDEDEDPVAEDDSDDDDDEDPVAEDDSDDDDDEDPIADDDSEEEEEEEEDPVAEDDSEDDDDEDPVAEDDSDDDDDEDPVAEDDSDDDDDEDPVAEDDSDDDDDEDPVAEDDSDDDEDEDPVAEDDSDDDDDEDPVAEDDSDDDDDEDPVAEDDSDDDNDGEDPVAEDDSDPDTGDDPEDPSDSSLAEVFTPAPDQVAAEAATTGDDYLQGTDEDDDLNGGLGDDLILASGGNDSANGSWGDDRVSGGDGEDYLRGGQGDDIVSGGEDDDMVSGGFGDDIVAGGDGQDVVRGNHGDDIVSGGADDDMVSGGFGDDILAGGSGEDLLCGGFGTDTAVFEGAFVDYVVESGDMLAISSTSTGETDMLSGIELLYFSGSGETYEVAPDGQLTLSTDDNGIADVLADPLIAEVLGVETTEVPLDAMVDQTPDTDDAADGVDADLVELDELGLIGSDETDLSGIEGTASPAQFNPDLLTDPEDELAFI